MSYEENLKAISYDADASIALYTGVPGQPGSAVPNGGHQFKLVRMTGKNQVGLATTAAHRITGVLRNKPQVAGQAATVAYDGVTKLIAGGAVAVDQEVVPDAQGRAVAGASTGGGRRVVAVTPAAGAGEVFSAQIL